MVLSDLKLLRIKEDFAYYILEIDKQHRRSHWDKTAKKLAFKHYDCPEKYPCLVVSEFNENSDGPDGIWHEFLYYENILPLIEAVAAEEAEREFLTESLSDQLKKQ